MSTTAMRAAMARECRFVAAMRLVCLCPTFNRAPQPLATAIACFEAQDYEDARLLVLDDGGAVAPGQGERWEIRSAPERFPSLPHKFQALVEWADEGEWDAAVVWEDDDVYLPWHLSTYAAALRRGGWAHPQHGLWCSRDGVERADAVGRFHGALAARRELLEEVGGWLGVVPPDRPRIANFDQRLIGALTEREPPIDPTGPRGHSYIYRWGTAGERVQHGSGFMQSPEAEDWYLQVEAPDTTHKVEIVPELDAVAASLYASAQEEASPDPEQTFEWTFGMATYDDYDGVYFTVQSLRFHHGPMDDAEFIVVDSFGCERTKTFVESLPRGRYIRSTRAGTAFPRNVVFEEARGTYVMCCDSHVLFEPGAIEGLRDFFRRDPDSMDLVQGPLQHDFYHALSTHFEPVWREQMWGIWGNDERAEDPAAEPFEIPMQGLGVFACRKDAWLGFNPGFQGFGGEEGYIHEKFRQAGRRCLCLPALRWVHRFHTPQSIRYPLTVEDKLRNYLVGHSELGLDLTAVLSHFAEHLPEETVVAVARQALWADEEEIPGDQA
jgi:hypothetical protein